MKRCRDCDTEKPVAAFYANRTIKSGIDSYCKPCRLERQRQWMVRTGKTLKPYGPHRRTIARDLLCRPIADGV